MKYGAIIVETRPIKNLPEIIREHMRYLPEWDLTIYYGAENEKMLKEAFPEANFNDYLITRKPENYCNDLFASIEFWDTVPYDKTLFFQNDSGILREGIEEFMEWDYIGAPWQHQEEGGNGGFSLRSKKHAVALLEDMPYKKEYGNEDEYFSKYLSEVGGRVAPREVCFRFSCETIFQLGSFGYHAIDRHLSELECKIIKTQYL